MKDHVLFGCYGPEGKLIDDAAGIDDALGELREEEIFWDEAEIHHQHNVVSGADDRSNGKVGVKIHCGDHRTMQRRSMLSRQMEMQANTWAAGSTMSAVLVVKQSAKGNGCIKGATDCKDYEVEASIGEEEGGVKQQMDHELIPPHELLARQYAASATTSSVLQGAGRTLKGMDLRRLRNEVWRQTGFAG